MTIREHGESQQGQTPITYCDRHRVPHPSFRSSSVNGGWIKYGCIVCVTEQRDLLRNYRDTLVAALNEALEYFEDREDVVDGDYGEPAPNKEMQLAQSLRAALKAAQVTS
jgi:hypothetical protein